MIKSNDFYNEIEKRYKKRKLSYEPKNLYKTIDVLYQLAKINYNKLEKPRNCSFDNYVTIWINEEIGNDIAKRSVGKINLNNPPNNFKATADFYKDYPPSYFEKLKKDCTKDWINFSEINEKWILVVKERNNFSLEKGYGSRVEMVLKDFDIPKIEYNKFLKNVDEIICLHKKQKSPCLTYKPTQNLDNFCLVCNSKLFPFKNLSDFFIFLKKNDAFYKKNKNIINIQNGNCSKTKYIKETDTFEITINKEVGINHQILDLIHELAHVDSMIKLFKHGKFLKLRAYYLEKSAIKKEIIFLEKYFPTALVAKLENVMNIICQTLFEIEIYENPRNDIDKIYLKYLEKCSDNINVLDGWNYLLNQEIIYKSFSQLIYAIAYVNVLYAFENKFKIYECSNKKLG